MKNLRNIFKGMALAAVAVIALSACDNKAPFLRLQAAVDSVQVEMAQHPMNGFKSLTINYDELTNTVVYTSELPVDLSDEATQQQFKAVIPVFESQLVSNLLTANEYNLGNEIICAEANIKLEFKGENGSNLETTVENSTILEAYDQVYGQGAAAKLRASQND